MVETETPIIAVESAPTAPAVAASTPSNSASESAPVIVTESPVAASSVEAPVSAEVKPEPAKVEAPVASSLLAAEPVKEAEKTPEAKPDDKKPVDGEVKPEVKTELAPEPPKYEAFKLPEGFKADEKVMGEFTGLLGQLEVAKGDHAATQEVGQKLVDLFHSKLGEATQGMTDYYKQLWEKQKSDDFTALQKDPILGGDAKAIETTARSMANRLAAYGGTKEEVTQFRKDVQARGVDNLPSVARVINNLLNKIDSYEKESSNMLPGTKPAPTSTHPGKNILQTMYGKKSG